MNGKVLGKRFIFAIIAMLAVSAVTVLLKFDGKTYLYLVGLVCGTFQTSQTITEIKKKAVA